MDKALKKIESHIAKLQGQRAKLIRDKAIPDIIARMRSVGLTPREIADAWGPAVAKKGHRKPSAVKVATKSVAPKYLHPTTGDTWTGRGRPPVWLREAEEAGQSRDEFLIQIGSLG